MNKPQLPGWTISRSKSRDGKGWHLQARTEDQLSSFACVILPGANLYRGKTADDKNEVFTLSQLEPHVTFNVVGKIRYVNDWEGVA